MLRFNDGTIAQVFSYGGTLYIEDNYNVCSLIEFDSRNYEIVKKGDENEDELS